MIYIFSSDRENDAQKYRVGPILCELCEFSKIANKNCHGNTIGIIHYFLFPAALITMAISPVSVVHAFSRDVAVMFLHWMARTWADLVHVGWQTFSQPSVSHQRGIAPAGSSSRPSVSCKCEERGRVKEDEGMIALFP